MNTEEITIWAEQLAETYAAPLGNRWLHVQNVVAKAREIGDIFNDDGRCYLIVGFNFS